MKEPDISVVIPVFGSVDTLPVLVKEISQVLTENQLSFEILFIEDGGKLESWRMLVDLHEKNPETVRTIKLAKNYGQNAATLCGIQNANGKQIITIDDDMQTPPSEIAKLLEIAKEGKFDVVYGRAPFQQQSIIRRMGSSAIKKLFRWVDGSDIGSSFRWLSPAMKKNLSQPYHSHLFINQVINWYTTSIKYVEVKHEPRIGGDSGYSITQLFGIAFRLLFFYTDLPLKVMTVVGTVISVTCFGLGIYFIYGKIQYGEELGFASIITALFFATGVITVCLSIIGHYINRIYTERVGKPSYAIEARL